MMADVVAAEWLKLRTARSTWWVLAVSAGFVAVAVLLTWQAVTIWDGLSAERRARFGLGPVSDLTAWLNGLCFGVLGVLSVTGEYRSGMIRTTFTAVPRRGAVVAAKAGVVGTLALAASETVTFAAFAASRLIVGDRPIPGHRTAVASELLPLLVAGALPAVFAMLGLGLAVVLRSTAGAIVSVAALWHVVPTLVNLMPAPWNERINSLMLGGLPEQVTGRNHGNSIFGQSLPPAAALALMVAYAAAPLAAAALMLGRRDA